jgi:hypothetical protein
LLQRPLIFVPRGVRVNDLLHLAAANAQVMGYGALTVACGVQVSHRLFQCRRGLRHGWFGLCKIRCSLARHVVGFGLGIGLAVLARMKSINNSKEATKTKESLRCAC